MKLNSYLENEAKYLCQRLPEDPAKYYATLAKVCFAQVIMFKRKISGEPESWSFVR